MAEKKAEIISVENLSDGRHLIQARTGTTQWTMEQIGDDDPIFLSRGTARTLGYGRDRDMNKLITRLYATQTEQRATASRCSPADGELPCAE